MASTFTASLQEFNSSKTELEQLLDQLETETDADAIDRLFQQIDNAVAQMSNNFNDAVSTLDNEISSAATDAGSGVSSTASESNLIVSQPLRLTTSDKNEHPRMAIDADDNIWLVWHRMDTSDVYAAKYFGQCGIWNAAATGGEEIRISNFAQQGRKARFPSVAVGANGEAHVVFQAEGEDGWDIYYSQSTGGGAAFTDPIKITRSPGGAMMPDVAVTKTQQGNDGSQEKVVIVWHDSRFGEFEIMAAERVGGVWRSSGQDGADIRITNADGNSMFPRIGADFQGNLRVTWQDTRQDNVSAVFMATYVSLTGQWSSSAFEGQDMLISHSPADALFPDIAVDHTGGATVAWHDLRHTIENPDQHEEVYALYCPKMGHPGGVHFPPLQPNIEARLDVDFDIVDCVDFLPIDLTNAPEVCLKIRAPGATFWRAANEDGNFTAWQQFKPNFDLETTVVPWTLTCVGGTKRLCVQVQDAEMVGFPICKEVVLTIQPPGFKVEFFEDEDMTVPLPTLNGVPVARSGDIFVRLTSSAPQLATPTFDVIGRGQHLVFNQETRVVGFSGFSGANSAGIGSFVGTSITAPRADDVSPVARAFSAALGREFTGRFHVKRHDGCFHLDGLARLIAAGRSVCGPVGSNQADDADFSSAPAPNQPDIPG